MNDLANLTPSRLKFARKRRGITIKKLSEKLGITPRTLSSYENGTSVPKKLSLALLSEELNFPESFFFLDEIEPINQDAVSFRSLARMSATVRDAALHASNIALEFTALIDKKFETPGNSLPELTAYDPESAADVIRNYWSLGERPVSNMVHLLESKGVMVFSLAEDTDDMDAYSFWMNNRAFVFLNTRKSVERSRFDAAHELGHLLLHRHALPKHDPAGKGVETEIPRGKEAESEANRFASAFLMPEKSIRVHFVRYPTLTSIISLKSFWLVSAAALIRRLKDLELLTEWQYRTLNIEISRHGYLKKEPCPILKRENSKLLPMLFQALKEDGVSKNDIARELGYFVSDLDMLMFNPSLKISVNASKDQRERAGLSRGEDKASHLRLVK
jgi:Zn-dependent peptidase ImmA (M78 family)/DNA-binding XRE family transcriptional regulator